jgi:hypothetical protein
LHTRRVLPTQLVDPGVQSQPAQRPVESLQLDPLPHAVVGPYERPSALQACVPVVPTHAVVPAVQSHGRQAPPLHDRPAAQEDGSQLRPSALQVSTTSRRPVMQRVAPGVQMRGRQAPSRQPSEVPQGMSEVPCPSALQTRRVVADTQLAAPGAHDHGVHAPVAATQAVIEGQAEGV